MLISAQLNCTHMSTIGKTAVLKFWTPDKYNDINQRQFGVGRISGSYACSFIGKTTPVKLTVVENGIEKERELLLINYHGVISAAM
jgi:hypothetical protein